jgi:hypothetical protein
VIGFVAALVGLASIVYAIFAVAISFFGLIAIVWLLLRAVAQEMSLFLSAPHESSTRSRSSAKAAVRIHGSRTMSTDPSSRGLKLGNDITIIAGDRTSGKALYSEVDRPPRAKHAEN